MCLWFWFTLLAEADDDDDEYNSCDEDTHANDRDAPPKIVVILASIDLYLKLEVSHSGQVPIWYICPQYGAWIEGMQLELRLVGAVRDTLPVHVVLVVHAKGVSLWAQHCQKAAGVVAHLD